MNMIILLSMVAFASAQIGLLSSFSTLNTAPYPLISRTEVRDDAGQFALSYKVGDGTVVNEQGSFKPNAEGVLVFVKKGSFAYITPEGIPIQLSYIADENGFRPEGMHIPVNVAAPEAGFA